jgi:ZIP family zinc transporter
VTQFFAAVSQPSERLQTNVQHFAAGIIFAAAALELLPPVREQPPIVAIIGFLAGIATMVASRENGGTKGSQQLPARVWIARYVQSSGRR